MSFPNYESFEGQAQPTDAAGHAPGPAQPPPNPMGQPPGNSPAPFPGSAPGPAPGSAGGEQPGGDSKTTLW